jgi:hypothetical protein
MGEKTFFNGKIRRGDGDLHKVKDEPKNKNSKVKRVKSPM